MSLSPSPFAVAPQLSEIGPHACGYMYIHPGTGLFSSWKYRWFDLRGGVLSYRKKHVTDDVEDTFNLSSMRVIKRHPSRPKNAKKKHDKCGIILEGPATNGAEVVILAESTADRDRWIRALQLAKQYGIETSSRPHRRGSHAPISEMHVPDAVVTPDSRGWVAMGPWVHPDWHRDGPSQHLQPFLSDPVETCAWYNLYFCASPHAIYIAKLKDAKKRPYIVVVTLMRCAEMDYAPHLVPEAAGSDTPRAVDGQSGSDGESGAANHLFTIRAIVWQKGSQRHLLKPASKPFKSYQHDLDAVLECVDSSLYKKRRKFKNVTSPRAIEDLLHLEEIQYESKVKIGVLYARDGQTCEEEMFPNDLDDPTGEDAAFATFLDLLGTTIPLAGWDGYRAGLDTENGGTGELSVFTEHHGTDIMFHVSAYLPHDRENSGQEVQRKRQIGNDICAIVFMDGTTPYDPATINCQFLHVYAVVQPDTEAPGYYRIQFARQGAMAPFGIEYPVDRIQGGPELVDFLLSMLLDGERTAIRTAPDFLLKAKRTDEVLLGQLYDTLEGRDAIGVRGRLEPLAERPEIVYGLPNPGPRRQAIVPVAVPGAESAVLQADEVIVVDQELVCWDHWETKYVFATTEGLFIGDNSPDPPIQVTPLPFRHVEVVDSLHIAVGQSMSGTVYVVYLRTIGDWMVSPLKGTKHASMFVLQETDELRLFVAIKSNIEIFVWGDCAFHLEKRLSMFHPPVDMRCLCNGSLAVLEPHVAYTIAPDTGTITEIVANPKRKTHSGAVILAGNIESARRSLPPVYAVSRDYTIELFTEDGHRSNPPISRSWSFLPSQIIRCRQFLLGFGVHEIEVRSLRNGSLVQSIRLPPPMKLLSWKDGIYVASGTTPAVVYHIRLALLPSERARLDRSSRRRRMRTQDGAADPGTPTPATAFADRFAAQQGKRRASVMALRGNRVGMAATSTDMTSDPIAAALEAARRHDAARRAREASSQGQSDEGVHVDEVVVTTVTTSVALTGTVSDYSESDDSSSYASSSDSSSSGSSSGASSCSSSSDS